MISEVKRVRVSNKVSLDKYDKWLNLKKKKKKFVRSHTPALLPLPSASPSVQVHNNHTQSEGKPG